MDELEALKEVVPSISIFFVRIPSPVISDVEAKPFPHEISGTSDTVSCATSRPHHVDKRSRMVHICNAKSSLNLFQQLTKAGYLSLLPAALPSSQNGITSYEANADSELCENFETFGQSAFLFARQCLQCYLVRITSMLHVVHTRCLQMFIMTAFDMARDMQITPKRYRENLLPPLWEIMYSIQMNRLLSSFSI